MNLELIEKDLSLREEKNFVMRADVLDWLESYRLDLPDRDYVLWQRAERLKVELAAIDQVLFRRLREQVRSDGYRGKSFEKMAKEYVEVDGTEEGYDHLDLFINSLFSDRDMPMPTRELTADMVEYHKTPARMVFEWMSAIRLAEGDVFFDLGCGLGQVVLLVNLLAGIPARGVEIEPAFCDYARACATELGLREVCFFAGDAREADYSMGTVFFLYTPFTGGMLAEVLGRLKKESLSRPIRIISYGPCTEEVARHGWLTPLSGNSANFSGGKFAWSCFSTFIGGVT